MTGSEVVMLKNLNPNQAGIDYMEIHAYDSFEPRILAAAKK